MNYICAKDVLPIEIIKHLPQKYLLVEKKYSKNYNRDVPCK